MFSRNLKKDAIQFVIKEIFENNEYYVYTKFNEKIIDASAYQWYVVIILKNTDCNYIKDYKRIIDKIVKNYYKENNIDVNDYAHWFHYIFVLKNENNKVMKMIDKQGYSFDSVSYKINYPMIMCCILLDSQVLCIPSINNGGFGIGQYRLMKNKLLKLLEVDIKNSGAKE